MAQPKQPANSNLFFNEQVITEMAVKFTEQLMENTGDLNEAYLEAGGDPLTLSVKIKIDPESDDGNALFTSTLSFVAKKITHKADYSINTRQRQLFKEKNE